jgi:hypothetical protein
MAAKKKAAKKKGSKKKAAKRRGSPWGPSHVKRRPSTGSDRTTNTGPRRAATN